MTSESVLKPKRGPLFWIGWIITILPVLALAMSAFMKVKKPHPEEMLKGMEHLGWSLSLMPGFAVVEAVCTLLYLIPQTAVLGAILLTGYLGGAIATHVRVGDDFSPPVIMGILIWVGLFCRDSRVRALIPWRR
ncbi:DoxX family protein [Planctomicrobium sp. SH661]|uniref:DoxX family protein n=1 Tax=Planctomicrobium sp. SH661 TaxID=3448124 RepID=UPI003F5CA9C6